MRLSTVASVVSLLVCVAIVALWVRSYWILDWYGWKCAGGQQRSLSSQQGGILLFRMPQGQSAIGWASGGFPPGQGGGRRLGSRFLGFAAFTSPPSSTYKNQFYEAPDWFLAAITAVLPMLALRRAIRDRRKRRILLSGRCATCGYDLRASNDRCPECGTPCGRL